jgi:hypothetical protein
MQKRIHGWFLEDIVSIGKIHATLRDSFSAYFHPPNSSDLPEIGSFSVFIGRTCTV